MDDLSGLDWSTTPADTKRATAPHASYNFANLRPTPPISGRTTPLNGTNSNPTSKPATPANDSFASLLSFNSSNTTKNLSLQERQKQLEEERRKQAIAKDRPFQAVDEQIWETLGSGRSTPALLKSVSQPPLPAPGPQPGIEGEDDFLAAFNKPSPATTSKKPQAQPPIVGERSLAPFQSGLSSNGLSHGSFDDDDDTFGLNQFTAPNLSKARSIPYDGDDDVLGLLGKPAHSKPKQEARSSPIPPAVVHPQDQAVAELVDMGFPVEKARQALETTESGTNVQEAVGFLLNQAHAESRQRSKPKNSAADPDIRSDILPDRLGARMPTRSETENRPQKLDFSHSAQAEKAPGDIAADLSTKFLKTAGSFWKQSTKKLQQAVEDFNSDSDSSQPKWMRENEKGTSERHTQPQQDETGMRSRRRRSSVTKEQSTVTDEAMMLETARPEPRRPNRTRFEDSSADTSRDHSPAMPSKLRETIPAKPAFLRSQQAPAPVSKPALSRAVIDEQASQAYVSSARRRKTPVAAPVSASESDLLNAASFTSLPSRPATIRPAQPSKPATPTVVRPPPPIRTVPAVSAIALKSSGSHREAGNAHFKRGDYSAAHTSYSTALSHIPQSHPIAIVLLTNRALTSLKVGEPKTAIVAADSAITLAGPAKGEGETVDLGTGDAPKPMRDYYGKALMRKAEALEQMERWAEAAALWREAVEGGHGGAASIQARARAERAANPPQKKSAIRKASAVPPKRPSQASQKNSAAAVEALRAANAAAEKADDEKFALSDSVDAKLTAWKGTKADNLRALLSSLDLVLWPEAGWKKISMADLVLPNKVKIQYMKGIAKVHPDKIPVNATTEQRMIAGAVFSTLNEAWDKFKTENGL